MADNFLSELHSTLQQQGKERSQKIAEWNKNNPPNKEISFIYCDEPATYGLWVIEDHDYVFFGEKKPNNKYDPSTLTKVPVEFIGAFHELLEHLKK